MRVVRGKMRAELVRHGVHWAPVEGAHGHLQVLYVSGKGKVILYCPCPQGTLSLQWFWRPEAAGASVW